MKNRPLINKITALAGIPMLACALSSNAYASRAPSIDSIIDSARAEREGYRCSILVRNPDGSVSQSYRAFSKNGKLLREYTKPYPGKRFDLKPQFHSTTPVLTYPDGTIEAYRPLEEGETLNDVLKEGPVERYVPKTQNDVLDNDGWMPARD